MKTAKKRSTTYARKSTAKSRNSTKTKSRASQRTQSSPVSKSRRRARVSVTESRKTIQPRPVRGRPAAPLRIRKRSVTYSRTRTLNDQTRSDIAERLRSTVRTHGKGAYYLKVKLRGLRSGYRTKTQRVVSSKRKRISKSSLEKAVFDFLDKLDAMIEYYEKNGIFTDAKVKQLEFEFSKTKPKPATAKKAGKKRKVRRR